MCFLAFRCFLVRKHCARLVMTVATDRMPFNIELNPFTRAFHQVDILRISMCLSTGRISL